MLPLPQLASETKQLPLQIVREIVGKGHTHVLGYKSSLMSIFFINLQLIITWSHISRESWHFVELKPSWLKSDLGIIVPLVPSQIKIWHSSILLTILILNVRIWNICQKDTIYILLTFITNIQKSNLIACKAYFCIYLHHDLFGEPLDLSYHIMEVEISLADIKGQQNITEQGVVISWLYM